MTPRPSTPVRAARVVLVVLGVVLLAVSGVALAAGVPVRQWGGILLWLAGAIVLHDAVFAPLVLVGSRLLRRLGRRISWRRIAVVQVALVVGAALTAVAFPAIRSQQLGTRNPTVLVLDYGLNLALLWGALGVLTALIVLIFHRVGDPAAGDAGSPTR